MSLLWFLASVGEKGYHPLTHRCGRAWGPINRVPGKQLNFWVWRSEKRCGLEIQVDLKVFSLVDRLLTKVME